MDDLHTITAEKLCFSYADTDVLHDVTLQLTPGSILGIVGPNGSGKSTLISLLAGLRRPQRGDIQWRGAVALVVQSSQAPDSLPLTVGDVVRMGTWRCRIPRRLADKLAATAMHRVGMQGLEDRPFNAISGGQRQRTLLAQALAQNAPTLILDEPTTGLDKESRRRIYQAVVEEAAMGRSVALVSHDSHGLAICDRVMLLEAGRIVPDTMTAPAETDI